MNIAEILNNVPKGTKLYSPVYGEVEFSYISKSDLINVKTDNFSVIFYSNGTLSKTGECMLFPSRENRNWDTFKKFDINTLKPFDKVLVRNNDSDYWRADLFSNKIEGYKKFVTVGFHYPQCLPYNEETKHLVGTIKDCPEYYKTW